MNDILLSLTVPLLRMAPRQLKGESSIATYITHKQLSGFAIARKDLISSMQEFSGADLLLFSSKLCLTLERDSGAFSTPFQLKIASDLLPPGPKAKYVQIQAARKVIDLLNNKNEFQIAPIVTQLHCVNFMKQVVVHHEFTGTRVIHNEISPNSPTKAFLQLLAHGDHLAGGPGPTPNDDASTRYTICELIRNSMFYHKEPADRLMGRLYRLLFDLPARACIEHATSKTIRQMFEDATAVSMDNYFSIGLGLLTRFVPVSLLKYNPIETPDPNVNAVLDWNQYLSSTSVPDEQKNALNGMFCIRVEDAKRAFLEQDDARSYSGQSLSFEYSLLPFMKQPLLEAANGRYILTHYPFLVEKFTSGIYWLIFDSLDKQTQGAFRNYWGHLCQQYIEEIFRNDIIPNSSIKDEFVYYDPKYDKGKSEVSGTDIMLFDHKTGELFLFEVTFSALRVETAFLEDNLAAFSAGVDKIVDKAKQIDTVMNDFRNGVLTLNGVSPSQVQRVRPFVVTMTAYPVWNFVWASYSGIWKGMYERLKDKNLLQGNNVSELRLLNAREMEYLGALQRDSISVLSVLRDWTNNKRWGLESLQNYLLDKHQRRGNPATLIRQFDDAGKFCAKTLFPNKDECDP